MVDIISKRDGPREQDLRARRFIHQNRDAIAGLADRLTQGGYSAGKAAQTMRRIDPPPDGLHIHDLATPTRAEARGRPQVKVSLNNRVVAYDDASGRQIHLLGEIRRQDGLRYFALAHARNGFLSPLPPDVLGPIEELDGQIIDAACPESLLAEDIAERLGFG